MKHNIIQITATAGLTVPHSINPIFQYIFDCSGFNPMNGNFDFVFQDLNRLWMVSVTLTLNGSPQKIVQRGQNIDYYVGCVSNGSILLEPNVVHVILFNF